MYEQRVTVRNLKVGMVVRRVVVNLKHEKEKSVALDAGITLVQAVWSQINDTPSQSRATFDSTEDKDEAALGSELG